MKKYANMYDKDTKCNLYLSDAVSFKLTGWTASVLTYLFKTSFKSILSRVLIRATGFNSFRNLDIEDESTSFPIVQLVGQRLPQGEVTEYVKQKTDWPYSTIGDYYEAYKAGIVTPKQIAEKLLKIISKPEIISLNAIVEIHEQEILTAADESTKRYKEGTELSIIDGVPFFVKEEIRIKGYTTCFGMDHYSLLCDSTAPCIQNILDAGAILFGYTSMVQLGSNPIGFNPSKNRPTCCNPFNTSHYSGGSSGGSAVVVSSGLCPFAIGVDGFGSVRIPCAMTGIVGIRPTYSRVSFDNVGINNTSPFCSVGVMACSVEDTAIVYSIIATEEPWFYKMKSVDMSTAKQIDFPSVILPSLSSFKLKDTKIAICSEYVSSANKSTITCFDNLCTLLMSKNAGIIYTGIPELQEMFFATTLGMINNIGRLVKDKILETPFSKTNDANLLTLIALSEHITPHDVEVVERQRTRSIKIIQDLFNKADILLLPNTCCTAPKIESSDQKYGILDTHLMNSHLHFMAISSLTGIPAISINIGYEDETGLPISAQLLAKWWHEDLLIALANEIQSALPLNKTPSIYFNPMK